MIYLNPQGGMCNRLRTIASTIKLLNEYGDDSCIVLWRKSNEMNCLFEDLFWVDKVLPVSFYNVTDEEIKALEKNIEAEYCFDNDSKGFLKKYKNQKRKEKKIFLLHSCFNYYGSTDYTWLHLQPPIQERVNILQKQFGDYCVGVHIRRTDNTIAIANSPISLFLKKLDTEVKSHDNIIIYVATDDCEVKNLIKKRYRKSVIENNDKIVNRNTREGMIDAAIDLFALAATDHIYGTSWSSYSKVASDIGQNKLIIVLDRSIKGLAFRWKKRLLNHGKLE